jgi:peptide chain release factor 3
VTQVFYPEIGSNWVIGVVGQLQLDVLVSRLEAEYKVAAGLEMAPFETARWVSADDPADLKAFADVNRAAMARDRDGNPVFMAKTTWEVGYVAERYPKVRFMATRER